MADYEKIILVVVILVIAVSITFSVKALLGGSNNQDAFKKAVNAQDQNDKCKAPAGYTQAEWEEHMGHHPEQYSECF